MFPRLILDLMPGDTGPETGGGNNGGFLGVVLVAGGIVLSLALYFIGYSW